MVSIKAVIVTPPPGPGPVEEQQEAAVIGIADLSSERILRIASEHPAYADVWLWCRRHEQPHKVGEKCKVPAVIGLPELIDAQNACVDVGPFMSELEANRCGALAQVAFTGRQRSTPLGMKIERYAASRVPTSGEPQ